MCCPKDCGEMSLYYKYAGGISIGFGFGRVYDTDPVLSVSFKPGNRMLMVPMGIVDMMPQGFLGGPQVFNDSNWALPEQTRSTKGITKRQIRASSPTDPVRIGKAQWGLDWDMMNIATTFTNLPILTYDLASMPFDIRDMAWNPNIGAVIEPSLVQDGAGGMVNIPVGTATRPYGIDHMDHMMRDETGRVELAIREMPSIIEPLMKPSEVALSRKIVLPPTQIEITPLQAITNLATVSGIDMARSQVISGIRTEAPVTSISTRLSQQVVATLDFLTGLSRDIRLGTFIQTGIQIPTYVELGATANDQVTGDGVLSQEAQLPNLTLSIYDLMGGQPVAGITRQVRETKIISETWSYDQSGSLVQQETTGSMSLPAQIDGLAGIIVPLRPQIMWGTGENDRTLEDVARGASGMVTLPTLLVPRAFFEQTHHHVGGNPAEEPMIYLPTEKSIPNRMTPADVGSDKAGPSEKPQKTKLNVTPVSPNPRRTDGPTVTLEDKEKIPVPVHVKKKTNRS